MGGKCISNVMQWISDRYKHFGNSQKKKKGKKKKKHDVNCWIPVYLRTKRNQNGKLSYGCIVLEKATLEFIMKSF